MSKQKFSQNQNREAKSRNREIEKSNGSGKKPSQGARERHWGQIEKSRNRKIERLRETQHFVKPKLENRFWFSKFGSEKIQTLLKPKNENSFWKSDFITKRNTKFPETKIKNQFSKNEIRNRWYFQKLIGDFKRFKNRCEASESILKMMMTKTFWYQKREIRFWKQPKPILFPITKSEKNDSKNSKIDLKIYGTRKPKSNPEIRNKKLL